MICELAGLPPSLVDEVRARYAGGEFQEAAAAAACCPTTSCVAWRWPATRTRRGERIAAVLDAGADSVHVFPLGGGRMETVAGVRGLRGGGRGRAVTNGTSHIRKRDSLECVTELDERTRARRTMRDSDKGWRVVGLHHVAFAHGPGGGPEGPLLRRRWTSSRHEESGPGFVERMFPVGDASCRRSRPRGRRRPAVPRHAGAGSAPRRVRGGRDRRRARGSAGAGRAAGRREARAGGMGTRIAFVHPSAFGGMLVELVEPIRAASPTRRSDRIDQEGRRGAGRRERGRRRGRAPCSAAGTTGAR